VKVGVSVVKVQGSSRYRRQWGAMWGVGFPFSHPTRSMFPAHNIILNICLKMVHLMRGHTLSKDHNNWCCGSKKPQIRLTALKLCRMTKQTHSIHTVDCSCCFCCTWADKVPKDWKQKLGAQPIRSPTKNGVLNPIPIDIDLVQFLT